MHEALGARRPGPGPGPHGRSANWAVLAQHDGLSSALVVIRQRVAADKGDLSMTWVHELAVGIDEGGS